MCGSGLSAVVARLVSGCLWGGWGSWGGVAGVPCPFPSVLWFVGVRGGGGGRRNSSLLVLMKLSFWRGDWALGYHSMEFRQFPDIS